MVHAGSNLTAIALPLFFMGIVVGVDE